MTNDLVYKGLSEDMKMDKGNKFDKFKQFIKTIFEKFMMKLNHMTKIFMISKQKRKFRANLPRFPFTFFSRLIQMIKIMSFSCRKFS